MPHRPTLAAEARLQIRSAERAATVSGEALRLATEARDAAVVAHRRALDVLYRSRISRAALQLLEQRPDVAAWTAHVELLEEGDEPYARLHSVELTSGETEIVDNPLLSAWVSAGLDIDLVSGLPGADGILRLRLADDLVAVFKLRPTVRSIPMHVWPLEHPEQDVASTRFHYEKETLHELDR